MTDDENAWIKAIMDAETRFGMKPEEDPIMQAVKARAKLHGPEYEAVRARLLAQAKNYVAPPIDGLDALTIGHNAQRELNTTIVEETDGIPSNVVRFPVKPKPDH